MYLSILKDYCFANMTPDNDSQTSQMLLGDAGFHLYFINKAHYEKVWVDTTHPGEGDCMTGCYASIGVGRLRYLAEDYRSPMIDTEQIYEAAKQYLDDYYHDEKW